MIGSIAIAHSTQPAVAVHVQLRAAAMQRHSAFMINAETRRSRSGIRITKFGFSNAGAAQRARGSEYYIRIY